MTDEENLVMASLNIPCCVKQGSATVSLRPKKKINWEVVAGTIFLSACFIPIFWVAIDDFEYATSHRIRSGLHHVAKTTVCMATDDGLLDFQQKVVASIQYGCKR